MKKKYVGKRALEILGLMMIGEGLVGLIRPRRYSLFWNLGPKWLRETVKTLAEHPEATRLLCACELTTGLWLALREIEEA